MSRQRVFPTLACVFALAAWTATAQALPISFQSLGDFPGGAFESQAFGVSGDGLAVVGQGRLSTTSSHGFRWTAGTGLVDIGDLPGGTNVSSGRATSSDGITVVGLSVATTGTRPFVGRVAGDWSTWALSSQASSQANAVSADGSVIVGQSGARAFIWTSGSGMVEIVLANNGAALGVSANGTIVVGRTSTAEAFSWTSAGGEVILGDLPGGIIDSRAIAISDDGSVIVGRGASAAGNEAVSWTAGGAPVGLGDLPGGTFSSIANAASFDGSTIVGQSNSGSNEAFVWTAGGGMQSLRDTLVGLGLDMTGWTLTSATGVSDDGLTIVGTGVNPLGQTEAWIATVPEPTSVALLALGLIGLLPIGWRRLRARR